MDKANTELKWPTCVHRAAWCTSSELSPFNNQECICFFPLHVKTSQIAGGEKKTKQQCANIISERRGSIPRGSQTPGRTQNKHNCSAAMFRTTKQYSEVTTARPAGRRGSPGLFTLQGGRGCKCNRGTGMCVSMTISRVPSVP